MNTHLIVCWHLLGITDDNKAVKLLSLYNQEAAKWLEVGFGDGVERQRISRRASGTSTQHMFVYVHEQARDKGFHTHELMNLPVNRAQAFANWSRDCLGRLTGQRGVDERAVFFSPASAKLKQFKPYEGGRESLTDMVDDDEIGHVLSATNEPIRSVRDLAGKAFRAGARDNISVILAKLDGLDAMTEAAGNTRLLSRHKTEYGLKYGKTSG